MTHFDSLVTASSKLRLGSFFPAPRDANTALRWGCGRHSCQIESDRKTQRESKKESESERESERESKRVRQRVERWSVNPSETETDVHM